MTSLGERQEELVRHLVAGGPLPEGFAAGRLAAASKALMRKRSGLVRRAWPMLAAPYGDQWLEVFSAWAEGRAPLRAELEGYDFALDNPPQTRAGRVELLVFEVGRRRAPAFAYRDRVLAVHLAGRVRVYGKVS